MYEPSSWTKLNPIVNVKTVNVRTMKCLFRTACLIFCQNGVASSFASRTKEGSRKLKNHQNESGTMKAIWDNKRALDVLDTLPFVKHGSYGTIGHSLGGHNSIFTAIFDHRIIAALADLP